MIYKRSVIRRALNTQILPGSDMEIKNDNDRRLWFRIKSIDKKLDSLGRIGSENFNWLAWESLTDESAKLYSELSVMDDILKVVRNQMWK